MFSLFLALCDFTATLALPSANKRDVAPSVKLNYAQVVGISALGIDTYKGIPYARPPVGNLRLRPPQDITQNLGTIFATGIPDGCIQQKSDLETVGLPGLVNNVLGAGSTITGSSEDCLTINVQVPSGTKAGAKLPVLFWIYGGGFEFGATQIYDGTLMIANSVDQKTPIIFVAINYRLSAFGFLGGKQLMAEGSTNLGLLDQRKGLEWVANNIAKFGGDPDRVTIWGESAGSISVLDHMVAKNGDNTYNGKALFRGAIMNSGSVIPAEPVDGVKGQAVYDAVVSAGGCKGRLDTLACLRGLSTEQFSKASGSLPGIFSYQSLALSYLPRPDGTFLIDSPDVSIKAGKIAKVPFIIGDQEDEGTLFALLATNLTTTNHVIDYLQTEYFLDATREQIASVVKAYPDDASAGSPFRTGPLYNIYPQFKRLAAILGDLTFTLTRRVFLDISAQVNPSVPSWSFLATYLHGTPLVGTFHANDILTAFGTLPGIPAKTYQGYYISFVNTLDPNNNKNGLLKWPQWSQGKQLLNIGATGNSLMADNFRTSQYNAISGIASSLMI